MFFAEARKYLLNTTIALANLALSPFEYLFRNISRGWSTGTTGFFDSLASLTKICRHHRWWLLAALLLLLLPVVLIVLSRNDIDVGTFADSQRGNNAVISALLAGERLTPPPALPPESFNTIEVTTVRPALINASRDWTLLEDGFSQRLLRVFQRMHEQGYEMALIEGYRSPERQNRLAAMGSNVTNAGAYQSYHQFGLAADCAFLRDGKLVINEKDPWAMRGYELYGEASEAMGLTWGGRWKMMDFGHVEFRSRKLSPPAS